MSNKAFTNFLKRITMKKLIIGALVGGFILFIWQFLSFAALSIHDSQMAYTDKQDAILEALATIGLEEGTYMIPRLPAGASGEDAKAFNETRQGTPWARVSYHKSLDMSMPMNMLRGFVIDVVAVFLLCWVLMQMANLDLKTAVLSSMAIGLMGYFTINYLDTVWFEGNSLPDLLDAVVQWGSLWSLARLVAASRELEPASGTCPGIRVAL